MGSALIELSGIERIFQLGSEVTRAAPAGTAHRVRRIRGGNGTVRFRQIDAAQPAQAWITNAGTYRLEERRDRCRWKNRRASANALASSSRVFIWYRVLTAAENIALPMTLAGVAPSERAKRVEQALKDYGLTNRAGHRPNELSGGQRQRVAIARATIMQPAMILADRPATSTARPVRKS